MNTQKTLKWMLIAALALALMAGKSLAQGIAAPAPQLPYGLEQVLKLEQAKVGDNVIIAYIYNSGGHYTLDASQLIYLKQQGVSDAVLTTMLTQPKAADASTPMAFSSQPSDANTVAVPATPAPAQVTYVPTDSADYGSSYGYPYYYGGWCWPFNVSWGWTWFGGGWHWNGGWHRSAGWGGGWHGGSAWSGGGWHGGGTWGGGWHRVAGVGEARIAVVAGTAAAVAGTAEAVEGGIAVAEEVAGTVAEAADIVAEAGITS